MQLGAVFDPVARVASEHRALLQALNADSEAARTGDQVLTTAHQATLKAIQGKILSQSLSDATSSR